MSDSTHTGVTYEYRLFTAKTPRPGTKKDYHPSSDESEAELNRLISDGWEIETTHTGPAGWHVFGTGFIWHMITFVLRRAAT
jgi:hypothetical protein